MKTPKLKKITILYIAKSFSKVSIRGVSKKCHKNTFHNRLQMITVATAEETTEAAAPKR